MDTSIFDVFAKIKNKLLAICPTEHAAEHEAWLLLTALTKKNRAELLIQETGLTTEQEVTLATWCRQRIDEHKPLQYILGTVSFCDVIVTLRPPVLIARPETEEWCSQLINYLKPAKYERLMILDMCTGSGAIGLALAKVLPHAYVIGTDISRHAIALAKYNAKKNNITNIKFTQSNLYTDLNKNLQYDLIISNPPYVSNDEWHNLALDSKKWEDKIAFLAGEKGLSILQKIINKAPFFLKRKSVLKKYAIAQLILEIGAEHKDAVTCLLKQQKTKNILCLKDLEGHTRVLCASF